MNEEGVVRVAMVDDHHLVRKGLVALVNDIPGYRVVLEAAHGKEFTEALEGGVRVDIAIVDLSMPVLDGYDTILWVSKNHPVVKCFALTVDPGMDATIRAMRNGARGVLRKNARHAELREALDQVRDTGYCSSGRHAGPPAAGGVPLTSYERQRAKVLAAITARELQLIKLICAPEELTYEEIAARMFVQASTIESHRRHLFERFGIKSKTGLVIFAYRWGIVPVDSEMR